jgi:hypothetical protein
MSLSLSGLGGSVANNALRGVLSGATFVTVDHLYKGKSFKDFFSKANLKRGGLQALSSFGVHQFKYLLNPLLGNLTSFLTDAYLTPVLVGLSYSLLAKFVLKDGSSFFMNFFLSTLSDFVGSWLEEPISKFLPGAQVPMSILGRPPANPLYRTF